MYNTVSNFYVCLLEKKKKRKKSLSLRFKFSTISFLKRREWLKEALSSIVEDTDVKRMMSYLQIIEEPQNDTAEDDLTEKEDAFEGLSMIVDNLDNANGMLCYGMVCKLNIKEMYEA